MKAPSNRLKRFLSRGVGKEKKGRRQQQQHKPVSLPPSPHGKTPQPAKPFLPLPFYSLSSSAASLSSSSSLLSLSLSSLGGDGGSCNNGSGASSAAIFFPHRAKLERRGLLCLPPPPPPQSALQKPLTPLKRAPSLAKPLLYSGTANARLRLRDILNLPTPYKHPKSNAAGELQFPKCRHPEGKQGRLFAGVQPRCQ